MREFTTAAWAAAQDGKEQPEDVVGFPVTVPIDGRKVKFNPASSGQITLVIAAQEGDLFSKVAAVTNFFFSLVDNDEDKAWFKKRLFDSKDAFGPGMIEEISLALIEEWGARPTQPASNSSSSQEAVGRKSTAKRHSAASTRSRSASTASST